MSLGKNIILQTAWKMLVNCEKEDVLDELGISTLTVMLKNYQLRVYISKIKKGGGRLK